MSQNSVLGSVADLPGASVLVGTGAWQSPSRAGLGPYSGCSASLVGNGPLSEAVAEDMASGGIAEISLAATDLLAPASMPISTFHPVHDWMSERQIVAEAVCRGNPSVSVVEFAHGGRETGALWQRRATARADVVVSVDRDAVSRLVNLICMQQVKPAVFAAFDFTKIIGEICFVIPRCSDLQYRGFPATRCRECSHNSNGIHGSGHDERPPVWFTQTVMQYVDAILLERRSNFADLLFGPNVVTFTEGGKIAYPSVQQPRQCELCS